MKRCKRKSRCQLPLTKSKVCPPEVGAAAGPDVVHERSRILSTGDSTP